MLLPGRRAPGRACWIRSRQTVWRPGCADWCVIPSPRDVSSSSWVLGATWGCRMFFWVSCLHFSNLSLSLCHLIDYFFTVSIAIVGLTFISFCLAFQAAPLAGPDGPPPAPPGSTVIERLLVTIDRLLHPAKYK